MKRASAVLLLVISAVACNAGPLPAVPQRYQDDRGDRFPGDSYDPLPLDLAIHQGTLDDVRRLLEQGENPNARWLDGERFPLQEVLESSAYGYRVNEPVEATRLLLRHGADANEKWCPFESRGPSDNGRAACTTETALTPLIFATIVGQRELVQLLLEAGADPLPRDWGGASALDYANDEVIFEMISRAMFPDMATRDAKAWQWVSQYDGGPYARGLGTKLPLTRALNWYSVTGVATPPPPPVDLTFRNGSSSAYISARQLARLNTLLRIGADPNQRLTIDGVDWTPLALALSSSNHRGAAVLLRNGARVNDRWCSRVAYADFKTVIGSDPACGISNGTTPLMFAAARNDRPSVVLLLQFKADRSLRDWTGRTARDHATTSDIGELLTEAR